MSGYCWKQSHVHRLKSLGGGAVLPKVTGTHGVVSFSTTLLS